MPPIGEEHSSEDELEEEKETTGTESPISDKSDITSRNR